MSPARYPIPAGGLLAAGFVVLGVIAAAGCGPRIIEKRILAQPTKAELRPGPSAEEQAGEVPTLIDLRPTLPLVPTDHEAPQPPPDPRPVALQDAPEVAPPLPPPPKAAAREDGDEDDDDRGRRDDRRRDDRRRDDVRDDDDDRGSRRGGVRVNPR